MAKKSQRRGGRARETKATKKWKKRAGHYGGLRQNEVFHNKDIEENWDRSKTLRQNYVALGLMMDVNADMQPRGPKLRQSLHVDAAPAVLTAQLEAIKALPKPEAREVKSMGLKEQRLLAKLIAKHDDDYKNMARDIKINIHQCTANELKRRVILYNRLQDL